jgi:hypothetical protein
MVGWIIRCLLFLAAPIVALFVSRDALNFGIIEMLVAIMLMTAFVMAAAAWTLRRTTPAAGRSKN